MVLTLSYFLEYDSWIREFDHVDSFSDEIKSRLIVALGMLYEYMDRIVERNETDTRGFIISTEDYVTNIAGRATGIYTLYRIKTGDKFKWPPWRKNAKVSITDVLFLAESGLVYANYKLSENNKICNKDEIAKIINAESGVEKSKIEKCIEIIKKKLNI